MLRPRNLAEEALTSYGGSTQERLLNESSRSYMLACYLSVCIATVQIFNQHILKRKHKALTLFMFFKLVAKLRNKKFVN
jgi:hypothetical protein